MKTPLWTLCAGCFLLASPGIRAAVPAEEEVERPILKTLKINVPGKIGRVVWSIQKELCVIQVEAPSVRDGQKEPEHPRSQVWLLKVDGTVIPQTFKPTSQRIGNANHTTYSTTYVFPASAKTEGVAVAISIDDDFFVERLLPVDAK
jgi:hypothetical protein